MTMKQIKMLLGARRAPNSKGRWRLYIGTGQNSFFEGIILDPNFSGMVALEQDGGDKNVVYIPHADVRAAELLS
jgi:hypothetical protein